MQILFQGQPSTFSQREYNRFKTCTSSLRESGFYVGSYILADYLSKVSIDVFGSQAVQKRQMIGRKDNNVVTT